MTGRTRADPAATLRRVLLKQEAELKRVVKQLLESDRRRARSASTRRRAPAARPGDQIQLTAHEAQILRLLVMGHNNRQIGAQLGVARGTIRNYLIRIYWKLGVTTRPQAAIRAVELGLRGAGPEEEA
jgi:LuxR family maltose regulon positive regulatory protein